MVVITDMYARAYRKVGYQMSSRGEGIVEQMGPVVLSAKGVAGLLGVSLRHVRRMDSAGRLPKPIRLGHLIRWPVDGIEKWIAMGCPDRRTFEAKRRIKTCQ